MRRKYIHKLEVWQNNATDDSFGGNTVDPAQLGSSWANVRTIAFDKLANYGLDIAQQAITISTRYRDDIDYLSLGIFFKYKGFDWYPTGISNRDLENEEIIIVASADMTEQTPIIATETFDTTFDNTFL